MADDYGHITRYLSMLETRYRLRIRVRDMGGCLTESPALAEALAPFLHPANPFCLYLESDATHGRLCRADAEESRRRLAETGAPHMRVCPGGLGEYVIPVTCGGELVGSLNAGYFPVSMDTVVERIGVSCDEESQLDFGHALRLYRTCIKPPAVTPGEILPGLEFAAEHLGRICRELRNPPAEPSDMPEPRTSCEDIITTRALEFICNNAASHILLEDLAGYCHCSKSYLSRIFKRTMGMNINAYINRHRVEEAKRSLRVSRDSVAEVATAVGFSDPSYFSRVFTGLVGISPTEYRRRYGGQV